MNQQPFTATPARPPQVPVSDAVLERLVRISSGSLATQLYKKGLMRPVMVGVRPLNKVAKPFAGRAYTMRFIPAREDITNYSTMTTMPNPHNLQWVGVEQVQPGEVMVIDSNRDPRSASMGHILITRMARRGCKGIVTDGSFRDGLDLVHAEMPVWSFGTSAITRVAYHHVADLQVPIGCAGVAVFPGDVIHSDGDSVTVVPAYMAEEMADLCEAQDDVEDYLAQRIAAGEPIWGIYPPSEETRQQQRAWAAAGRPRIKPAVQGGT